MSDESIPARLVDGAAQRIRDRMTQAGQGLNFSWPLAYREDMEVLIAAMKHYYEWDMDHSAGEDRSAGDCQLCPIVRGLIGAGEVDSANAEGPDGAIVMEKISMLWADIHIQQMEQAKKLGWNHIDIGDEQGRLTLGITEALFGRTFICDFDEQRRLWIYTHAKDGDTYRMQVCKV